ncbi:hypothetical protein [Streptomyces sp. NPDC008121]|uniref:hypothetical protein n=1 Tax=Streptomyces sp. NPDC008121 TaxID=3364809 RepID=UPI0036E315C3
MAHEPAEAGESEILAVSLRTYLSEAGFAFTGLTGKEATQSSTRAVVQWVGASGWRCRTEAQMRYIEPPRLKHGGCIAYWSPSWSAYLDLRVIRKDGPPVAVEIDRADESTAVDKLRDEALRGRPALWIRWHGALRAELPAGVARLHLPTRSSKAPQEGRRRAARRRLRPAREWFRNAAAVPPYPDGSVTGGSVIRRAVPSAGTWTPASRRY